MLTILLVIGMALSFTLIFMSLEPIAEYLAGNSVVESEMIVAGYEFDVEPEDLSDLEFISINPETEELMREKRYLS